jgi:hypothetical protein
MGETALMEVPLEKSRQSVPARVARRVRLSEHEQWRLVLASKCLGGQRWGDSCIDDAFVYKIA